MIPLISSMLLGLFQRGTRSRLVSVDATDAIHRVTATIWGEVAASRGLELDADPRLCVHGALRGVACEVLLVREASSQLVTSAVGKHGAGFEGFLLVAPKKLSRSVAAAVLGRGVRTGDPDFDARFVTVSNPRTLALAALDDSTRTALLALAHREPRLSIDGQTITLELQGAEMVHEHLSLVIDLVTRVPQEKVTSPYRAGAA